MKIDAVGKKDVVVWMALAKEVEPLFATSPYINRISETLQMPKKTALESLRLSFIDYVLKI